MYYRSAPHGFTFTLLIVSCVVAHVQGPSPTSWDLSATWKYFASTGTTSPVSVERDLDECSSGLNAFTLDMVVARNTCVRRAILMGARADPY